MVEVQILIKILLNKDVTTIIFLQAIIVPSNVLFILLKKDFTQEFLTFNRTEQRRLIVMTSARNQPLCRKYNINIGCYDVFRVCPRKITQRNTALKIHNNHFRLIWRSNGNNFKKNRRRIRTKLRSC